MDEAHPLGRPWRLALRAGVVAAVALAAVYGRDLLLGDQTQKRSSAQRVALLNPERTPPKPKEPEPEKPAEVEEEDVEKIVQSPSDAPQEAPAPGDQLGVNEEGGAVGDSFGLAARRGGRDITTIGENLDDKSRSGRLNPLLEYASYTSQLERFLTDELMSLPDLRKEEFRAVVSVWIAKDGRLSRLRFRQNTGDADLDRRIERALESLPPMQDVPPESMPQPVVLRLQSRRTG
ncbi:MAG: TonB C-terminal domain-containing protein [Betaproteobacteria bacterium]|nr:TonB C-terminal domain-containing protein [Betaproteobacteria bacterium]